MEIHLPLFRLHFVNQAVFVSYNGCSSERVVFCFLIYRLPDVCHSILLAPRRYVELFRRLSARPEDIRHSLEYWHLFVYVLVWHRMPDRIHQLGCMEQEHGS